MSKWVGGWVSALPSGPRARGGRGAALGPEGERRPGPKVHTGPRPQSRVRGEARTHGCRRSRRPSGPGPAVDPVQSAAAPVATCRGPGLLGAPQAQTRRRLPEAARPGLARRRAAGEGPTAAADTGRTLAAPRHPRPRPETRGPAKPNAQQPAGARRWPRRRWGRRRRSEEVVCPRLDPAAPRRAPRHGLAEVTGEKAGQVTVSASDSDAREARRRRVGPQ